VAREEGWHEIKDVDWRGKLAIKWKEMVDEGECSRFHGILLHEVRNCGSPSRGLQGCKRRQKRRQRVAETAAIVPEMSVVE
jgi:hypothetical protein